MLVGNGPGRDVFGGGRSSGLVTLSYLGRIGMAMAIKYIHERFFKNASPSSEKNEVDGPMGYSPYTAKLFGGGSHLTK